MTAVPDLPGGWLHDDGTPCPSYLAPVNGTRWWCTEHQQYLKRPDEAAATAVGDDAQRFRDYGRERLEAALAAAIDDGSDLEVLGELELALMALAMYYGSTGPITLKPEDVVEIIDEPEPACICPPGLVARGGFRSGCPVHA